MTTTSCHGCVCVVEVLDDDSHFLSISLSQTTTLQTMTLITKLRLLPPSMSLCTTDFIALFTNDCNIDQTTTSCCLGVQLAKSRAKVCSSSVALCLIPVYGQGLRGWMNPGNIARPRFLFRGLTHLSSCSSNRFLLFLQTPLITCPMPFAKRLVGNPPRSKALIICVPWKLTPIMTWKKCNATWPNKAPMTKMGV